MEPKANYLFVGIMVSVLTVAALAFVLWVSEFGARRSVDYYTIYFSQHSLSGLQVDSDVTMKGIKVGVVTDFILLPTNVEQVKVTIRVDEDTPIKEDTIALIKRNLLTGLATINLAGTSQNSLRLTYVRGDESYPVIKEGEPELAQITNSLPVLFEDFGKVLQGTRNLLSNENIESVSATIKHVEAVSANLHNRTEEFRDLTKKVELLVTDVHTLSTSLKDTSDVTKNEIGQISEEFKTTLKQFAQTASQIEKKSGEIGNVFSLGFTRLVLDVSNVTEEISHAAQSFSNTMEQFDNPRSILVGPNEKTLGPGEKQK